MQKMNTFSQAMKRLLIVSVVVSPASALAARENPLFLRTAQGIIACYERVGAAMPKSFDEAGDCGGSSIWADQTNNPTVRAQSTLVTNQGSGRSWYRVYEGRAQFIALDSHELCGFDLRVVSTDEDGSAEVTSGIDCQQVKGQHTQLETGMSREGLRLHTHQLEGYLRDNLLAPDHHLIAVRLDDVQSAPLEAQIRAVLVDHYIDDIVADCTVNASIERSVKNLNYRKKPESEVGERLARIWSSIEAALALPNLQLCVLDSTGYGSFGEGNGYALWDAEHHELLMVITGYAE
jgi:hypothetical protein